GLKPKWGSGAEPPDVPPYVGSAGDARNGAKVFAAACAGCHGDDGRDGSEGSINEVAFLSLISNQALRRVIITGRAAIGIPGAAARPDARSPDVLWLDHLWPRGCCSQRAGMAGGAVFPWNGAGSGRMGQAGAGRFVPPRRNADGHVRESDPPAVGREDVAHR